MKRIGGLFENIADARTIVAAAHRASAGKRHRQGVVRFLRNLDEHAAEIVQQLRSGDFTFEGYTEFAIRDPKTRTIQAPSFRDRVIHHAIIQITGPVFEMGATERSYACRAGRGQHAALAKTREWLRRDDWFLKIDVRRFYNSISHDCLREGLRRRFRETGLLDLFDRLLDSYEKREGYGLPIGALTSQYLGNFYLDVVDHWILQRGGVSRHVRYMDDLLLLGGRDELLEVLAGLRRVLDGLELSPKEPVVMNRVSQGVPYLGYTLYPDRLRLDRRGRRRLRRKLHTLENQYRDGVFEDGELQARCGSLFAHAAHADDLAWRQMVSRFSGFGEGLETGQSRAARRLVGQFREELPLGLSQQEQAGQPQQEHRLPSGLVSWHGEAVPSPDVAPSRAAEDSSSADETTHQSLSTAEIGPDGVKKGVDGAAGSQETDEA